MPLDGGAGSKVTRKNRLGSSIESDHLFDWSPEKDCCLRLRSRQIAHLQSQVALSVKMIVRLKRLLLGFLIFFVF